MTEITKYLKNLRKLFPDQFKYFDYIISNGVSFTPEQRNTTLEKELIDKGHSNMKKECFYNSRTLICKLSDSDYKYYEGWYLTPVVPFPFEHAFIVKNTQVIDLTSNGKEVTEYFGIEIPLDFLLEQLSHDAYGFLLFQSYIRSQVEKGENPVISDKSTKK
jgi:hypothetical protein